MLTAVRLACFKTPHAGYLLPPLINLMAISGGHLSLTVAQNGWYTRTARKETKLQHHLGARKGRVQFRIRPFKNTSGKRQTSFGCPKMPQKNNSKLKWVVSFLFPFKKHPNSWNRHSEKPFVLFRRELVFQRQKPRGRLLPPPSPPPRPICLGSTPLQVHAKAPAQPGATKVLRGRGPPRPAGGRGNLVLHFLLRFGPKGGGIRGVWGSFFCC